MPELPEMENYRRLLHERVVGRPITDVQVEREKTINLPVPDFATHLRGNSFTAIERRGKHLLFHLQSGRVLLLHLMLGGFLYWGTEEDKLDRTAQVALSTGARILYFHGLRLGYLHLLTREEADERMSHLGPEPLDPSFTADAFSRLLKQKRSALKSAWVDQHLLAGIGNCYADEICFRARILPLRRIPTLSPEDIGRLYEAMRTLLPEAIRYGGYMETPLFREDRLTGGYNERCLVYDRGNEPCPRCGHPITQDVWSSRKVFYCPHCQH